MRAHTFIYHHHTTILRCLEFNKRNVGNDSEPLPDQLEQRSIMPSGDYQIQVHLIECRDLTGLHDPYVRVKVMGE